MRSSLAWLLIPQSIDARSRHLYRLGARCIASTTTDLGLDPRVKLRVNAVVYSATDQARPLMVFPPIDSLDLRSAPSGI